jgi:hypothetical protein
MRTVVLDGYRMRVDRQHTDVAQHCEASVQ